MVGYACHADTAGRTFRARSPCLTLDELTDQLVAAYRSGRTYDAIEQAHRVLSQTGAAPRLAEFTFRALLELGLGGPARELLQMRTDLGAAADLQAALENAPNGRVRWADCRDTFQRNVTALLEHRPHLQELADSLPQALGDVHLHRTTTGNQHISRRRPGQLREWLPDLTNGIEQTTLQLPPRGQLGPAAVIGARVGPVMRRIYEDTHRLTLSYSHPLYVLEPHPVRFAAWLHCADHTLLLNDERVYVFVGADAVDALDALLTAEANLPLPVLYLNQSATALGETMTRRLGAVAERVTRWRLSETDACAQRIEQRYRDRDAAYWAERFRPPGRILAVTSRYTTVLQHSARDTLHALEKMGYETHMLIEEKDHHQLLRLETCRRVLEVDPVMVLSLDHLRYENPHLPDNLPLLTWIQDPMPDLLCREAGESVGPFDFVCGYYHDPCVDEFGYPTDAFTATGIPVSTRVFHDGEVDQASFDRYACDVCFVSNASEPTDEFYRTQLAEHPPEHRPLLELIYRRAREHLARDPLSMLGSAAREMVRAAIVETGVSAKPELEKHLGSFFAYRLLDLGRRQQTLEWVAAWARRTGRVFRIYGRGWEAHPTLAEFAAGLVEHGEPLRCAYRSSKLALQLIPAGFKHQRALEILACGTLPLTRYCPLDFAELPIETYVAQREAGGHPDGFATIFPRLERVVFRTPEEFENLAERYLADEPQRDQVSAELREVVLRDYTYDAVMHEVIASFRNRIERQAVLQEADCHA